MNQGLGEGNGMKIYIAGKITGLDWYEAFNNFCKADDMLVAAGHEPINPMKKVSEQEGYSWADYMKEDIPLLLSCDAIYLLSDWGDSKGARLEKVIAEELGMELIFESRVVESALKLTRQNAQV
jgi:hypothetical protein